METKKKISRKLFFKSLLYTAILPFSALWIKGIKRNSELTKNKKVIIPANFSKGINFRDNYIIVKEENKLVVFSSRCTHLGCKIITEINGKLVCPCHGSKFNKTGIPISGPANKSLNKLNFDLDKEKGNIIIYG